jgi:hypothetical protein
MPASARANSSTPALSETLMRARFIGILSRE